MASSGGVYAAIVHLSLDANLFYSSPLVTDHDLTTNDDQAVARHSDLSILAAK